MDNLIQVLLSAKIDTEQTAQEINAQMEDLSKQVNPLKIPTRDVDFSNQLKDIENIVRAIGSIDGKTRSVFNSAGELQKVTRSATDEYGRQIQIVSKLNAETGEMYISQKQITENLEQANKQLASFKNSQLLKIDKHTGDSPSAEMQKLRDLVSGLSADTENLREKQAGYRDAISRVIDIERQELALQKQINRERDRAEKEQSKALWGMSKETLSSRTSPGDGLKQLNDWYKNLEKLDQKINKFQSSYQGKIKEFISAFGETKEIQNFASELEKLGVETPNVTGEMDRLQGKFTEIQSSANAGAGGIKEITQSFGGAIKQAMAFAGVHLSMFGLFNEIKKGVGIVNDMNAAMTEIGMVTNKSVDEIGGLAIEYNQLAKDMYVSTDAVMDGAVKFTRQGLEQEEIMKRLQATTKFSKVTNLDFADSVEYLTATVNAMGIDIDRATDVFTYLGDATATSGAEVSEGFNKTAGTARAMNLEFEKVTSWIAGISATTREAGSTIGRSINMIISRMSRLTEEGFDEEDGTQINDVAKALDRVGLSLTEQDGSFRNFAHVIDDVAAKWDTLTDKEKVYVANAIAGARHQSRFFNLMEAYPETIKLYEGALDSAGTTQEKFGIYAESTGAKADKLRSTIDELWLTLLEAGTIQSVLELMTKLVSAITVLTKEFGGLGGVVLPIATVAIAKFALEIAVMGDKAGLGARLIGGLSAKIAGYKSVADAAAAGSVAFKMALGGIVGVLAIATVGMYKYAQAKKEANEAVSRNLDKANELNAEAENLEELAARQRELTAIEDKSEEQKRELLNVQRELAETYPELTTGIDGENNAIAENVDLTDELISKKREATQAYTDAVVAQAKNKLPDLKSELDEIERGMELQSQILRERGEEDTAHIRGVIEALDKNIERHAELTEEIAKYESALQSAEATARGYTEAEVDALQNKISLSEWARAEQIEAILQTEEEEEVVSALVSELEQLGFTTEEVALIRQGCLDEVRQGHELLTQAEKDELAAITSLDATSAGYYQARLSNESVLTSVALKNSQTRINAIQAEIKALSMLAAAQGVATSKRNTDTAVARKTSDSDMKNLAKSGKIADIMKAEIARKENQKIDMQRNEMMELRANQVELESLMNRVNDITVGGGAASGTATSGTGGGGKGKKPKKGAAKKGAKVKEYNEQQNAITELEKSLKDLEYHTNRYQKLIKDTKSSEKQQEAIKKTSSLYQLQQDHLHAINNEMRSVRKSLGAEISSVGVAKYDDSVGKLNLNLEAYSSLSQENKEIVDKKIKEFDSLTDKIHTNSLKWYDLKNSIRETNVELIKMQNDKVADGLKYLEFDLESITFKMAKLRDVADEEWQGRANRLNSVEDYFELQNQYLDGLAEKRVVLQELLELRKQDLEQKDLSIEQNQKLKDQILEINKQIRDINETMFSVGDTNKQDLARLADDVVAMYKKVYEKKKEAALKALDDQMDVEEKRHKQAMDNYDKEAKALENIVKAKLDELDKKVDEIKYQDKLRQEQEERQRILNELNKFGMDDSIDGKHRVSQLNEELDKQNKKIADMKFDRDIDLRRKNLQDQLNKSKEEIQDNKTKEQEKLEQLRERYEEEKEATIEHYDNILNNEREFAMIREEIMRGHFGQVYEDFSTFIDSFSNDSVYLGDVITQNITDRLKEISGVLEVINSMSIRPDGTATVDVSRQQSKMRSDFDKQAKKSQQSLINNVVWLKGKWEEADRRGDNKAKEQAARDAQYYYQDMDEDYKALLQRMTYNEAFEWYKSGKWERVRPSPKQKGKHAQQEQAMYENWVKDNIVEKNEVKGNDYSRYAGDILSIINLKDKWTREDQNFKAGDPTAKRARDASAKEAQYIYQRLPDELVRILKGMDYNQAMKWYESGKYRNVYHTGGVVGGKASPVTEILNKLANQRNSIASNEQLVKALNRELMIPEVNIKGNLSPNLQAGLAGGQSGGNINIGSLIDIEKFNNNGNADIKDITDQALDQMFKNLKSKGYRMSRGKY